jgi:uncharacterized protein
MKGTIVNAVAVLAGSGIGLLVKTRLANKCQQTVMQGIALAVAIIGLQMALKTQNVLIVILSMVIGGLLGEYLNIDGLLNRFGAWLTTFMGRQYGNAGEGFVTASLVYCVGAMAILGAIQDGLTGDAGILYAKAMLDGVTAVVLASGLGIGVALSSLSILVYQGLLTLLAVQFAHLLSEKVIAEMTATGGLLIIAISLLMLKIQTIRVANLLPAIPLAAVIAWLWAV